MVPDVPDRGEQDNGEEPVIRVEAGGPYRVSDGLPLSRTAQVETEHGEPIGWAPLDEVSAGKRYALCRCGHSGAKPFCDRTHERIDWDHEETANRGPRAQRAKTFEGEGVVMTDDRSICSHAGYCGDRSTTVWRMIRRTSDPEVRARLERMVELCPSGSLAYAPTRDAPAVEPDLGVGIAVAEDGPLWVRGEVRVESADGFVYEVRNRVTLCRCGASANKPFCDGSHQDIGFRDG